MHNSTSKMRERAIVTCPHTRAHKLRSGRTIVKRMGSARHAMRNHGRHDTAPQCVARSGAVRRAAPGYVGRHTDKHHRARYFAAPAPARTWATEWVWVWHESGHRLRERSLDTGQRAPSDALSGLRTDDCDTERAQSPPLAVLNSSEGRTS